MSETYTPEGWCLCSMGTQKCPIHKVCLDCGHTPCPHCKDWCDELIYKENGELDHLCCEGGCRYE